ncbi:MAG: hypothetical protein HFH68_04220 [Lachnospiraceae bacterium]|nr:hypothetical protein [Lachnospiraceae bacterium]
MLNGEELLFLKNEIYEERKLFVNGSAIHIRVKKYNGFINGKSIIRLISDLKSVLEWGRNDNLKIILDFDKVCFSDKLVYILCECMCSILVEVYNINVQVNMDLKTNIITYGLKDSCMKCLGKEQDYKGFVQCFNGKINDTHYRKTIDSQYAMIDNYLGKIMEEIANFLTGAGVDENAADDLSEVVSELAGNAYEHTSADCLIDIDVAPSFYDNRNNVKCYGINVVVLNFSNKLLGDGIKRKISGENLINDRYKMLDKAYKKHSIYFDENYNEDDFYNIMAFQHGISERIDNSIMGGTGLTCLINSLCEKSTADNCYVMSGNKAVLFKKGYLEYNTDKWLGFNNSNDIFDLPDRTLIDRSAAYFCGVAYNLNFVINKKEEYCG